MSATFSIQDELAYTPSSEFNICSRSITSSMSGIMHLLTRKLEAESSNQYVCFRLANEITWVVPKLCCAVAPTLGPGKIPTVMGCAGRTC